MYYIGIDGGGTHTRVEIRGENNEFLRRSSYGAFNMAAIGESEFRMRIREILADSANPAGICSICIGGAGSSGGAMEAVLRQELAEAGFHGKLTLCGDHEIALAGAMEDAGIILIAGTGSICCGRNESGAFFRCGGWGHLLDDCGSAYALGREALSAALQTEDGRLTENQLHTEVMQHLHAKTAADLVRFAYYESRGKSDIAALAPLVLECATENGIAHQILEDQAMELIRMVCAVADHLQMQHPKIALLGGLLEHENLYSQMVKNLLSDFAELTQPKHDALWGAAELAYRYRN